MREEPQNKEYCCICHNVITRDFLGNAIYCAGCGALRKDYDGNKLKYCNQCDCFCGVHPCEHTLVDINQLK